MAGELKEEKRKLRDKGMEQKRINKKINHNYLKFALNPIPTASFPT